MEFQMKNINFSFFKNIKIIYIIKFYNKILLYLKQLNIKLKNLKIKV